MPVTPLSGKPDQHLGHGRACASSATDTHGPGRAGAGWALNEPLCRACEPAVGHPAVSPPSPSCRPCGRTIHPNWPPLVCRMVPSCPAAPLRPTWPRLPMRFSSASPTVTRSRHEPTSGQELAPWPQDRGRTPGARRLALPPLGPCQRLPRFRAAGRISAERSSRPASHATQWKRPARRPDLDPLVAHVASPVGLCHTSLGVRASSPVPSVGGSRVNRSPSTFHRRSCLVPTHGRNDATCRW